MKGDFEVLVVYAPRRLTIEYESRLRARAHNFIEERLTPSFSYVCTDKEGRYARQLLSG
jgi:hypothetical protein